MKTKKVWLARTYKAPLDEEDKSSYLHECLVSLDLQRLIQEAKRRAKAFYCTDTTRWKMRMNEWKLVSEFKETRSRVYQNYILSSGGRQIWKVLIYVDYDDMV